MLSIYNLSFYFGSRVIYENANLHIRPKDRIGLIGPNGTGKSTLLRLIDGEYKADKGEISRAKDCTIGFLNQDLLSYQSQHSILHVAMEAFVEANDLKDKIDTILHRLETEYSDELINQLTDYQSRYETLDGYSLQSKAEEILEGLGFRTEDLGRPLKEFSGGWRMRVMLAKLLLQKPSLLLLDEPTNHLDLPSIQWIENYLQTYEGAIVVVSHDRYFIDTIANVIVEVSGGQLVYYAGNYEFYLEEKTLRQEIQKSAFENQQQKIKQTERFIERFRAKATKARQVQSRVKALERMELLDDVIDATAKVNFRFNFSQQTGKIVLDLKDVGKKYDTLTILNHTRAQIEKGDKIALIGANGKGKSTLLRIIAGDEAITGERQLGYNVKMAFYAQHQLESLHVDNSLLEELKQAGTQKTETELRNILGCFLFAGEEVFKKIKILSGGEKSRVALAKVLISHANFLLLDEPTNHLDIQSVNILIQALQQYEGSYVVVSHDRFFIAEIANKIWYIENQQIKEYPGTYEEYEYWRSQQVPEKKSLVEEKKKTLEPATPKTEESPEVKAQRKNLKELQRQLEKIENEVSDCEKQKKALEQELAKPEIYENAQKLAQTQAQYDQINQTLDKKQTDWENLVLQMEDLEKELVK
jgi:ATP-binding cassette, subfamily F, member 3